MARHALHVIHNVLLASASILTNVLLAQMILQVLLVLLMTISMHKHSAVIVVTVILILEQVSNVTTET